MLRKTDCVQDAEFYRKEITEMVKEIKNLKAIKFIYGVALSSYKEEKAREFP